MTRLFRRRSLFGWLATAALVAIGLSLLTPAVSGQWTETLTTTSEVSLAPALITANLTVKPESLNEDSNGKWITAFAEFPPGAPAGCTLGTVDIATVKMREAGDDATIPADRASNAKDDAAKGHFKFLRSDVVALLGSNSRQVTVEVFGKTTGCDFSGTDDFWYEPPKDNKSVAPAPEDASVQSEEVQQTTDTTDGATGAEEQEADAPQPDAAPDETTEDTTEGSDTTAPETSASDVSGGEGQEESAPTTDPVAP